MKTKEHFPRTLLEAVRYFSDPDVCLAFMVEMRWPNGVECSYCASKEVSSISTRHIWKCKGCKKQFSAKVGTIFEDSPIGFEKWLPAVWMIANDKNGISSYEIHREIGVTQKTAWFMLHRIRLAMQTGSFAKFSGEVEADETYIGGLARNMHKHKRAMKVKGTGGSGKAIVAGLLERHGKIRVKHIRNADMDTLQPMIRKDVEPKSEVFTDAWLAYKGLDKDYVHKVIDHSQAYVDGNIHTNGIENFWSLLKRTIRGTYVSVEPFHLFRYLDEQSFRFNNRKDDNAGRFAEVVSGVTGKRVTYKNLTGKENPACLLPT